MTSRIVLETKYGKIIRATPQASGTTLFCRLPYTKKPSPIEPNSNPQRRDDVSKKRLTVKLRGRTIPPDWSRGRTLLPSARGDTAAIHGTHQRLLGRTAAPGNQPRPSRCPDNSERCKRHQEKHVVPHRKVGPE